MTDRPAGSLEGLPSPEQVIELLAAQFALAGYEIENVTVDNRTQPPRIVVVADGDTPLDLEPVAELSRSASERLDALETGAAYVLEVTSPGVDRPLTTEKHFRRARGRKVEIELADLWDRVIEHVSLGEPQHRAFLTMTKPLGLIQSDGGITNLLVAAPNVFAKDVLESRLRTVVKEVLSSELGGPANIAVMVDES